MIRQLILSIIFLLSTIAHGQGKNYRFLIEFLLPDNNQKPAPFFELEFNGVTQKSSDKGYINYFRADGVRSILLTLTDSRYVIAGPAVIGFPEDTLQVLTIMVHERTNREKGSAELARKLQLLNTTAEDLKKGNTAISEQLRKVTDSLLSLLSGQYKLSEDDLREGAAILSGRDKYFGLISSSLEEYLNEVKDVRDAFKKLTGFYMQRQTASRLLDSTIRAYNNSYMDLNTNNNEYEKAVETYWQSRELADNFHNTFDYAINLIHRTYILPLNSTAVKSANEYMHETNRRKKDKLKEQITAQLDALLPLLDNSLVVLESKIKYFIGRIEFQKNILNK